MLGADEPIRVLRVIARLNVGGPSLHVSYLTEGLAIARVRDDARGREISEGEASMAFVAEQRGIEVRLDPRAPARGLAAPRYRASFGGSPS